MKNKIFIIAYTLMLYYTAFGQSSTYGTGRDVIDIGTVYLKNNAGVQKNLQQIDHINDIIALYGNPISTTNGYSEIGDYNYKTYKYADASFEFGTYNNVDYFLRRFKIQNTTMKIVVYGTTIVVGVTNKNVLINMLPNTYNWSVINNSDSLPSFLKYLDNGVYKPYDCVLSFDIQNGIDFSSRLPQNGVTKIEFTSID